MSKTLFSLIRFYLLWIIIFFLERLIFILYFSSKIFPLSVTEFVSMFFYGLRMDASMAAYICALPLFGFIVKWFIPSIKIPVILLKIYSLIIVVLCAIFMAVNLNIY